MKSKFNLLVFFIFIGVSFAYGANFSRYTDKSVENSAKNLRLVNVKKSSGGIELIFNRDIARKEYKVFDIDTKQNYRSIIDIKAVAIGGLGGYKGHVVDDIRVAQFDSKTVRVVFDSNEDIGLKIKNDGSMLDITPYRVEESSKPKSKTKEPIVKTDDDGFIPISSGKKNRVIVIDAGHGGKDPGAVGIGGKEKNIVLNVALKTGKNLQKMGYKVYFTRNSDKFINLRARTSMANDKKADLFISIHANAAPNASLAKQFIGLETYFLSPARSERSKRAAALENKSDIEEMNYFSQQTFLNFLNREKIVQSNKLAIDMQKQMLSSIKKSGFSVSDGGVKEAPFWVLVGALMPAVLVEVGYITHPIEGKNIAKISYQDALANGVANAVAAYFAKNF